MGILFANNAGTTLSTGVAFDDNLLPVVDPSVFPSPAAGEYFYATLASPDESAYEIVKVSTVNTSDELVVTRGEDGTTAQDWPAGTKVELRWCRAAIIDVAAGWGVATGNWQAYTPIWTSLSSPQPAIGNGSVSARWRRVGDSVEVLLTLTVGSSTTFGTDEWYFSLPPGMALATAAGPLGQAMAYDSNVAQAYFGSVLAQGADKVRILTGLNWRSTHPMTWASGDYIFLRFTAQIDGWSSPINLAQDFTEYVSCDGTESGGGTAANTVYTPTPNASEAGSLVPAVTISSPTAVTVTSYDLAFKNAIKPSDLLFLEVNVGRGWTPLVSGIGSLAPYSVANGVHTGILLDLSVAGPNLVRARFSNAGGRPGATYGTGENAWADMRSAGYKWRVRKVSNGNFAEAGSDSYSTTETLTNKKWIDGKPIYRKVISCGALPNNTTKTVAHGVTYSRITRIGGYAFNPTTTETLQLAYSYPSVVFNVGLYVTGANITLATGTDRSAFTETMVILEYTK